MEVFDFTPSSSPTQAAGGARVSQAIGKSRGESEEEIMAGRLEGWPGRFNKNWQGRSADGGGRLVSIKAGEILVGKMGETMIGLKARIWRQDIEMVLQEVAVVEVVLVGCKVGLLISLVGLK